MPGLNEQKKPCYLARLFYGLTPLAHQSVLELVADAQDVVHGVEFECAGGGGTTRCR